MRTIFTGTVILSLALVLGCQRQNTAGGPGVTGAGTGTGAGSVTTMLSPGENTFTIDTPNLATSLDQGEAKTIDIGVKRGKNFDQDVKLDFSAPPPGVSLDPPHPVIKASQKDVQVKIEAAKDAALGEHELTVDGTPAREGAKASAKFKINIKKKD